MPPSTTAPDPYAPADPVDELPFGPLRRPTGSLGRRKQRFQPCPLRIGEVEPPRHR